MVLFEINNEYPSDFCNGCPKRCYISSRTDIPSLTSRASINYQTIYSIKQDNKITYPVFRASHLARKFAWQITKKCIHHKQNQKG